MTDEDRLTRIEARLDALEGKRPGRKGKPIIVRKQGVCGVDPERNSAVCPDASLWRRQGGCLGTGCANAATEYYSKYRERKRKRKAE